MKIILGILIGVIGTQAMFIPWGIGGFSSYEWVNEWNGDGNPRNREDYLNNRHICLYRMDTPDSWYTSRTKINCIEKINDLYLSL